MGGGPKGYSDRGQCVYHNFTKDRTVDIVITLAQLQQADCEGNWQ